MFLYFQQTAYLLLLSLVYFLLHCAAAYYRQIWKILKKIQNRFNRVYMFHPLPLVLYDSYFNLF